VARVRASPPDIPPHLNADRQETQVSAMLRPVEAVRAWLDAAGITEGPVFRPIAKGGGLLAGALTAQSVALVIKAHAERAGFDPAEHAGHSLRAGFLTTAAEHGAHVLKMMEVSRHCSVDTLRGFVEALDRKRGKGPQVVRVERVVVQEGGQAIVGNVSPGAAATLPRPAVEAATPGPALDLSSVPEPALAPRRGQGEG
jgi:hypothetical protein